MVDEAAKESVVTMTKSAKGRARDGNQMLHDDGLMLGLEGVGDDHEENEK